MSEFASSLAESYRIVDVEVTCSSFLYRMVRKTLGSAVSVAKGIIPIEQIDGMFSDPAQFYDDNTFLMLKPNGLYLKRVNYENPDLN
jgi:tRNA U38,U39,U40 pseudouridine synthase TruA